MAESNTVFRDSAKTICELMSDPRERERIEAREDYNRRMRTIEIRLKRAEEIERRSEEIERRSEELELQKKNAERQAAEEYQRRIKAEKELESLRKQLMELQSGKNAGSSET